MTVPLAASAGHYTGDAELIRDGETGHCLFGEVSTGPLHTPDLKCIIDCYENNNLTLFLIINQTNTVI